MGVQPAEFYSTDWIAEALLKQCYRRFVTLRFDYGLARHYNDSELRMLRQKRATMWRVMEEKTFYEIHTFTGDKNNPTDLSYFIKAGVKEFIPEVSTVFDLDRTDTVIIDLDPKDPNRFSFEDTRQATDMVLRALVSPGMPFVSEFKVEAVKLRFSGNRSFHIYVRVDRPHRFPELREAVKKSIDLVTAHNPLFTYKNLRGPDGHGRKDYLLIDIGALSRHRCVRSLWSLHHKTGLVCVPVPNLHTFDRESATPEKVLAAGPVEERFV